MPFPPVPPDKVHDFAQSAMHAMLTDEKYHDRILLKARQENITPEKALAILAYEFALAMNEKGNNI